MSTPKKIRVKVSWDAGTLGTASFADGGVVVPCKPDTAINTLCINTAKRAARRPGNDLPEAAQADLYLGQAFLDPEDEVGDVLIHPEDANNGKARWRLGETAAASTPATTAAGRMPCQVPCQQPPAAKMTPKRSVRRPA